ncbi:MAG: PucR family transcriptional regulator [Anaerovorax sp.]|nr:PucR family transcriptional regulator [Anaerovorax sp.]
MLTVKEILHYTFMDSLELVAGQGGLGNQVHNVGILEYEQPTDLAKYFFKGDLVVTTLFAAKNDPELANRFLQGLVEIGVAAIAIKKIFFHRLSDSTIQIANQKNIPIFFYGESVYTEEIISAIKEDIQIKSCYWKHEEKLNSILKGDKTQQEISDFLYCVNPNFKNWIQSVYLCKKNLKDDTFLLSLAETLHIRNYKLMTDPSSAFIKYGEGILFLLSHDTEDAMDASAFLEELGIDLEQFYVSVGICKDKSKEFKAAVESSLYVEKVCELWDQSILFYDQIGIYKWLLPIREESNMMIQYHKFIGLILDYDIEKKSNLMETAVHYINSAGDIGKTAIVMHQHPNTIRYRLQKLRQVLNFREEDKDGFYEQLYLAIKLYEYLKINC